MSENKKKSVINDDCLEAMDHLYEYLNDEITDEENRKAMEYHLNHCRSCFTRAELERNIDLRLKESGKEKTPENLKSRLHNLIDDL